MTTKQETWKYNVLVPIENMPESLQDKYPDQRDKALADPTNYRELLRFLDGKRVIESEIGMRVEYYIF